MRINFYISKKNIYICFLKKEEEIRERFYVAHTLENNMKVVWTNQMLLPHPGILTVLLSVAR